ncbi:alpha-E domain-containing protein [Hymenobacter volaticus]|uniref:Alpha-E domain-containing protein n=1 Tax=Hymenobacter volaticus TaxID=2932254 RepID=A0ABY4G4E5_9BACT|nr:alpha-E domain-containing protein [Hymenobacter volaticus]UOQ65636.1 alpha-E domain-containing protein [Hymenobacter volaticus]
MLSRVADTIYWLGRYMERTQSMLQVVRISYITSQDEQRYLGWKPLLNNYGDLTREEINETVRDTAQIIGHLVFDKSNAVSAYNNIMHGRENARAVQDHITKEVWQSLNEYYHTIRQEEVARHATVEDPVSGLDILLRQGLLFSGTVQHTMPRDEGYVFLNMGKYLERAIQTTDIIRLNQHAFSQSEQHPMGAPELRYVLYALYGHELYSKTYKGILDAESVLHMIVYNQDFPHSLSYSLRQLMRGCERLKDKSLPASYEQLRFLVGKVKNSVTYSGLQAGNEALLDQFLLQTRNELLEVTAALNKYYFGNS